MILYYALVSITLKIFSEALLLYGVDLGAWIDISLSAALALVLVAISETFWG